MNERAREALVAAALRGVRQIKGNTSDNAGGRCAMGVLYEDYYGTPEWWKAIGFDGPKFDAAYGLTEGEVGEIVWANNELGWDFLTIARKIGAGETC